MNTAGLILAGGQSSRIEGHKFQMHLGGLPLVDRTVQRLSPQVDCMAVNLPQGFVRQNYTTLYEPETDGGVGPLAGVLVGLNWAKSIGAKALVTVPVDVPFFPTDMVRSLSQADIGAGPACAVQDGRRHGLCALWSVKCLPAFTKAFTDQEVRTVNRMLDQLGVTEVPFKPESPWPFFNINTAGDLEKAEQILKESMNDEYI